MGQAAVSGQMDALFPNGERFSFFRTGPGRRALAIRRSWGTQIITRGIVTELPMYLRSKAQIHALALLFFLTRERRRQT